MFIDVQLKTRQKGTECNHIQSSEDGSRLDTKLTLVRLYSQSQD